MKALLNSFKNNKKKGFLVLFTVLILSIGFSYAYYMISLKSDENNVAKSDCFKIDLTSENDAITLNSMYPISDEEGLKTTGYTFTIKNICSMYASYQVNLEDLEVTKKLSNEYVKVSLNNSTPKLLSTYQTVTPALKEAIGSYMLTGGTLAPKDMDNSSKTYTLKLWMDYDTPLSDATTNAGFKNKIAVIATARTKEELANNLAVNYNGTYTENKTTIDVSAHSDKYNIIEYSYDNLTFTSLDNPSKDVNITVDNTNNTYQNIYFKDEVGNVTEKSINNSAVSLVGSKDGEKTKVEISNIPSSESVKEYQFSTDNTNWITSDENTYSFDNLGPGNTLYGKVVYTDNNVDTYAIDSTNFAVAKLNDTIYSSLNAAIGKASGEEKSTVYLLKDTCENINVAEDKNVSLDLQSHSVSCNDNTTTLLTNNGTLEIKNGNLSNNLRTIANNGSITQVSGTISSTLENNPTILNNASASYILNDGVISSKKSNVFVNQGTFNMNGGTISSDIDGLIFANMGGEAIFTAGDITSSSQNSTLIYNRVGTVNLNGINLSNQDNVLFNGDSNGYHEAILNINAGNFSANGVTVKNYAVINHKGGTISSDNDTLVTVLNEESSTYNLNGGSISSAKSNAIKNNGNLEMISGNLTSAGDLPTLANDSGTSTLKGGTIANTGTEALVYNATGTVNIDGIELNNDNLVIKNGDENATTGTINIKSGIISSTQNNSVINYATINHSGGTVSSAADSKVSISNRPTGTYNLDGGRINGQTNALGNIGTFVMTSGTMTTNSDVPTYYNNGGTTTLKGGTIQNTANGTLVYNISGTTNIDGINLSNQDVAIQNGNSDNNTAILNINSGMVSSENNVSLTNYATVNHYSGTVSSNATTFVAVNNQVTGNYSLNGGSIASKGNAFGNFGTFIMTSGTMTTSGDLPTYYNNGGTTTLNGGSIKNTGGNILIYNLIGTTNLDGINLTNTGTAVANGSENNNAAILNIKSGTLSSEEKGAINNYGTINHYDGTVLSTSDSYIAISNQETATYNFSGGMIKSKTNSFSNAGTFVMTSGTMVTEGDSLTFYNAGGTATLKGGDIQITGNNILIYNLTGTVNVDGTNLNNTNSAIYNGSDDVHTAILNIKSGTILSKERGALYNYATVNHYGGTVTSTSTSHITLNNENAGTYNLSGGAISSKSNAVANYGAFTMTSGTMIVDGSNLTYYNASGTTTLKGGNIQNTGGATLVYNASGTVNMVGMSLTNSGGVLINGASVDDSNVMNLTNCNISSTGSTAIGNNGVLTITNGTVSSSAGNAINNARKVIIKGSAKITSSIKNYPTIYNASGATLTKDSTVTVTNSGGGTAIYNAS